MHVRLCMFSGGHLYAPITNPPSIPEILQKTPSHAPWLCGCWCWQHNNPSSFYLWHLTNRISPSFPTKYPLLDQKSRVAGWSVGCGPNPLIHIPNKLLLLSKWTALLWVWNTSTPDSCPHWRAVTWICTCMKRELRTLSPAWRLGRKPAIPHKLTK